VAAVIATPVGLDREFKLDPGGAADFQDIGPAVLLDFAGLVARHDL
jgi:hypothetical protein